MQNFFDSQRAWVPTVASRWTNEMAQAHFRLAQFGPDSGRALFNGTSSLAQRMVHRCVSGAPHLLPSLPALSTFQPPAVIQPSVMTSHAAKIQSRLNAGASSIPQLTSQVAHSIFKDSKDLRDLNNIVDKLKDKIPDTRVISYMDRISTEKELIKAEKIAEDLYSKIRASTEDISLISKNTNIPKNIIQQIKDHIFIQEHILYDGTKRFPADLDIADAWIRLSEGKIVLMDLKLLQHELAESLLMRGATVPWIEAHPLANTVSNWQSIIIRK